MRSLGIPALLGLFLLAGPPSASAQELPRLLDAMARVATLYVDEALEFTCVEQLIDMRFRSQRRQASRESHRFDYFYVYNEDPDEGPVGLQDYRTYYAPDGGTAEPVRLEPNQLGVPAYLTRAYSWIFLFTPALRVSMNFRLEDREEALGRPAYVISFRPVEGHPPDVPLWVGRMWIDRETYQLLRVSAARSDDYIQRELSDGAARSVPFLFTHAVVEFDFEKNGLRFPSVATVEGRPMVLAPPFEEAYRENLEEIVQRGLPYDVVFRVRQEYRDYRFFGVRTAEEVRRRVLGVQPE